MIASADSGAAEALLRTWCASSSADSRLLAVRLLVHDPIFDWPCLVELAFDDDARVSAEAVAAITSADPRAAEIRAAIIGKLHQSEASRPAVSVRLGASLLLSGETAEVLPTSLRRECIEAAIERRWPSRWSLLRAHRGRVLADLGVALLCGTLLHGLARLLATDLIGGVDGAFGVASAIVGLAIVLVTVVFVPRLTAAKTFAGSVRVPAFETAELGTLLVSAAAIAGVVAVLPVLGMFNGRHINSRYRDDLSGLIMANLSFGALLVAGSRYIAAGCAPWVGRRRAALLAGVAVPPAALVPFLVQVATRIEIRGAFALGLALVPAVCTLGVVSALAITAAERVPRRPSRRAKAFAALAIGLACLGLAQAAWRFRPGLTSLFPYQARLVDGRIAARVPKNAFWFRIATDKPRMLHLDGDNSYLVVAPGAVMIRRPGRFDEAIVDTCVESQTSSRVDCMWTDLRSVPGREVGISLSWPQRPTRLLVGLASDHNDCSFSLREGTGGDLDLVHGLPDVHNRNLVRLVDSSNTLHFRIAGDASDACTGTIVLRGEWFASPAGTCELVHGECRFHRDGDPPFLDGDTSFP